MNYQGADICRIEHGRSRPRGTHVPAWTSRGVPTPRGASHGAAAAARGSGRLDARSSVVPTSRTVHSGVAKTLSLVRANLPVTGTGLGRWLGIVALTTDFIDGRLVRHTGTTTPFGRFADPLADTAFWTWLYPVLSVTVRSFSQGQMIEPLQPRWIRPTVILQILIATRALQRQTPADHGGFAAKGTPTRVGARRR